MIMSQLYLCADTRTDMRCMFHIHLVDILATQETTLRMLTTASLLPDCSNQLCYLQIVLPLNCCGVQIERIRGFGLWAYSGAHTSCEDVFMHAELVQPQQRTCTGNCKYHHATETAP